jgi:hypothetical protein
MAEEFSFSHYLLQKESLQKRTTEGIHSPISAVAAAGQSFLNNASLASS